MHVFPLLLVQQPQDQEGIPWGLLVWVLIFFVLPMVGKAITWVGERLQRAGGEGKEARALLRERRDTEAPTATAADRAAGVDAWSEIAMDERSTPTVLEAPPRGAEVQPTLVSLSPATVPTAAAASSPAALDILSPPAGESIGEALVDLDIDLVPLEGTRAGSPASLSILDRPRSRRVDQGRRAARRASANRPWPPATRGDWRRAVVLGEILGAPVALRRADAPGTPPGLQ